MNREHFKFEDRHSVYSKEVGRRKEEVRNPPTAAHGYATDCYNTQGGANEDSELKNYFGYSNFKFIDFD